jgi:ATP phosphoribosyltransferase
MSSTFTIAIPSKGRLKETTLERFATAGLTVALPQDARTYRGSIAALPQVEVAFMSASEIARELVSGGVQLGVTGEDLAWETIEDVDRHIAFEVGLQFGRADVVVAVPEAWIDVETIADLGDVAASFRRLYGRQMRIGTKYFQLTTRFFDRTHGIDEFRIVESLGATEGAPAAGLVDIIVDITSTGSTLKANDLKVLEDGVILKSQATLMRSKAATQDQASSQLASDVIARLRQTVSG